MGPRSSRRTILDFQNRRLRELVAHAERCVPYYRKLFAQHGVQSRDIRGLDHLARLPITTRAALQDTTEQERVARGVTLDSLIERRTSGSTGAPLSIRRSLLEERILGTLRIRTTMFRGMRPTDRVATIVQGAGPLHPRDHQLPLRVLQALGLFRRRSLACTEPAQVLLQQLQAAPVDVLSGFPANLWMLAREIEAHGACPIAPRLIFAGGEVMTPAMREQVVRVFDVPVLGSYGAHEFNMIASQCAAGAWHVCAAGLILEVLKEDGSPAGPGERGQVVGTALHSWCMPFIRYRLGDIVTVREDNCACGQPFAMLESIVGRMNDFLTLADGRTIHAYQLLVPLVKGPYSRLLRQFQITQEHKDRFVVTIVPLRSDTPAEAFEPVKRGLHEQLGVDVDVRIELVSCIETEQNAKFRPVRTLLGSPYDGVV